MKSLSIKIRQAKPSEFTLIGQLMMKVYAALPGFPSPIEQPTYYAMLGAVGDFTAKPDTELIVAAHDETVLGAVVFFGDMQHYGSGGSAIKEKDAAGFRLLAVDPEYRGLGIGTLLITECINRAILLKSTQVIIHSTQAMKIAWRMYDALGFTRSEELDFLQGDLQVFGFRLNLNDEITRAIKD